MIWLAHAAAVIIRAANEVKMASGYIQLRFQMADKVFFLKLSFQEDIFNWNHHFHHDRYGNLVKNLKYKDEPVDIRINNADKMLVEVKEDLDYAIQSIGVFYDLWRNRKI